jgi:hypothetical protein
MLLAVAYISQSITKNVILLTNMTQLLHYFYVRFLEIQISCNTY